jgi:cell division protease FtsH
VEEAYQKAKSIIESNADGLVAIAEALLEREVLDGAEVLQLVRGETLPAARTAARPASGDEGRPQPVAPKPEGGIRVPPLVDGPQPA